MWSSIIWLATRLWFEWNDILEQGPCYDCLFAVWSSIIWLDAKLCFEWNHIIELILLTIFIYHGTFVHLGNRTTLLQIKWYSWIEPSWELVIFNVIFRYVTASFRLNANDILEHNCCYDYSFAIWSWLYEQLQTLTSNVMNYLNGHMLRIIHSACDFWSLNNLQKFALQCWYTCTTHWFKLFICHNSLDHARNSKTLLWMEWYTLTEPYYELIIYDASFQWATNCKALLKIKWYTWNKLC